MKAPKLWRKRRGRGGKFTGSYYVTISGVDVNLGTSDANEAEKRRREAMRGKRNFADELEEAAAAVDGAPETPPAAPPPSPPPIVPDSIIPPPAPPLQLGAQSADDARAEAEATNAAAGDVGGEPANDNAAPAGGIDPSVLDQFLEQGAHVLVDAQLELQAALIKRRTGRIAGQVPPDSALRKAAAQAWVAQLKIWFPENMMLPPWAMALIIPALAVPGQWATSTEPPKESGDQPMQAAA